MYRAPCRAVDLQGADYDLDEAGKHMREMEQIVINARATDTHDQRLKECIET